jgi:hypothetical protein
MLKGWIAFPVLRNESLFIVRQDPSIPPKTAPRYPCRYCRSIRTGRTQDRHPRADRRQTAYQRWKWSGDRYTGEARGRGAGYREEDVGGGRVRCERSWGGEGGAHANGDE